MKKVIRWDWSDEYREADQIDGADEENHRKALETYRIYRAATMLAMACVGIGFTFLCIGACMMHLSTIIMGLIMGVIFSIAGYKFDTLAEEELDDVLSP